MGIKRKGIEIIKILFPPIVHLVRAFRAYKHMNNWRKYVIDGQITIAPRIPEGIFTIDIRSALAMTMFDGSYEEETMSLLPSLPVKEGVILNIGANIGFYAVQLARLFPDNPIIAIEPNPEAFALLTKNISQNKMENRVRTLNVCIGSAKGKVSFSIIPGKPEYSSMNGIIPLFSSNNELETIEIETYCLSNILEREKIALIVMDVEGAEQLVLEGGKDIIIRDKPLILCECADVLLEKFQGSSFKLFTFFENIGYTIRDPKNLSKRLIAPFEGNILAFYTLDDKLPNETLYSENKRIT